MERLEKEERERLQRLLAELRSHQASIEGLRQHISALAASLTELSMTVGAIRTIKELKPDTRILVPIGSDSFITAKIADADKVITGLGADVAAERGADDAAKVLGARAAELEQAVGRAREQLSKMEGRVEALRPEAEQLIQKARAEPKK